MATSEALRVSQGIISTITRFTNADPANTPKLILQVGADGAVLTDIIGTSDDTTARQFNAFVSPDSSHANKVPLHYMSIPAYSGLQSNAFPISLFDWVYSTSVYRREYNGNGNGYIELPPGSSVWGYLTSLPAAGKVVGIFAKAQTYTAPA
jgi:hypothetical protein